MENNPLEFGHNDDHEHSVHGRENSPASGARQPQWSEGVSAQPQDAHQAAQWDETMALNYQSSPSMPAGYGNGEVDYSSVPFSVGAKADNRGFFATLFDFSFSSLITVSFVKVIYLLHVIFFGLVALGFLITALDGNVTFGVVGVLFGWIPLLFALVLVRVVLETIVSLARIAQNTSAIRESLTGQ